MVIYKSKVLLIFVLIIAFVSVTYGKSQKKSVKPDAKIKQLTAKRRSYFQWMYQLSLSIIGWRIF